MHLLHFVITRHFIAACEFSSDSTGPVLRTWIFFRRSITNRFFFPERRKGTLPYVADDSCPAQTARPPRCHYGVDIVCIFLMIAAAPRPLRLRRGFVVTTAPLNDMLTLTTYDFLLQLCNNFVKENHIFEWNYFKLEHRKILQSSASERRHEVIMKT